jgi:murein DD-endopeptidase MepM/ murein hydrolase activator NlpD
LGVLTWIIADYRVIKAKMPLLARLQEVNDFRESQFAHLSERIKHMDQKMVELQALDQDLKVMVNSERSGFHTEDLGLGGSKQSILPLDYSKVREDKDLVLWIHRASNDLQKEMDACKAEKTQLYDFFRKKKMLFSAIPSIWPTKGWLSSRFGYRTSPFSGRKEFHDGIDISTRLNAPVVAPADGIVSSIRRDKYSGKVLCLNHGYGFETVYGHLQKILVRKGKRVARGETVALVGNTGRSTGPHLHYEVHLHGISVNPLNYIPNEGQSTQLAHLKGKRMKVKQLARTPASNECPSQSGVGRLSGHRTSPQDKKGGSRNQSNTVHERDSSAMHEKRHPEQSIHSGNRTSGATDEMDSFPYSLYLGSYRNLKSVEKAASMYATKGLSTYWTKVDLGKKGRWYRVFAKHFRNKEEAEAFEKQNGITGSEVKRIKYANFIGTYSREDEVEDKILSLSKRGFSPYTIEYGEQRVRLFVGAFFTEAGANSQYHELQSKGIQNKVVMR